MYSTSPFAIHRAKGILDGLLANTSGVPVAYVCQWDKSTLSRSPHEPISTKLRGMRSHASAASSQCIPLSANDGDIHTLRL